MSSIPFQPRGMYFEDFKVGQRITTVGRTVTEADVVAFAGLSGDFNQLHTDVEYASKTHFGQRVVYGLLGLSIASGLATRTGILEGTAIAFREISDWKFVKPVFIGDTIHVELEVSEVKPMNRIGGGSVVISVHVVNQHSQEVMRGSWNVLVVSRPEAK
ncbi:MAG: MaoC/PaaZ C-terminal domain-containing protein [Chloroflexota bacterium]